MCLLDRSSGTATETWPEHHTSRNESCYRELVHFLMEGVGKKRTGCMKLSHEGRTTGIDSPQPAFTGHPPGASCARSRSTGINKMWFLTSWYLRSIGEGRYKWRAAPRITSIKSTSDTIENVIPRITRDQSLFVKEASLTPHNQK